MIKCWQIKRVVWGVVVALLSTVVSSAQHSLQDTLIQNQVPVADSSFAQAPVVLNQQVPSIPAKPDTSLQFFNQLNHQLPVDGSLVFRFEERFDPPTYDYLFYLLAGALLVLGIIRMGFAKYFSDLIRIFSQTAIRQKSLREQLVQNRLASLLLNLFFCFSAGAFLFQLAMYKQWLPAHDSWWQQLLLCIGLVVVIYTVKYVVTWLSGWLFGLSNLAESYIFLVFLINKVMGILLLPATIALALGAPDLKSVMVVATLFVLGLLYLYRYVIAIPLVRQHVKIIPFHFFLYFCAFEIVPVLIIYKWMLSIISH